MKMATYVETIERQFVTTFLVMDGLHQERLRHEQLIAQLGQLDPEVVRGAAAAHGLDLDWIYQPPEAPLSPGYAGPDDETVAGEADEELLARTCRYCGGVWPCASVRGGHHFA